ncbi:MAG: LysM peptidoglycan-binding domain-containing protein [Bacteroidota bacterium]
MKIGQIFRFLSLVMMLSGGIAIGQNLPQQNLSYEQFLQDCINFKKRGKVQEVWVVNFWASWHSNSLTNLTQLTALQQQYKNKPVRFIFVSTDKIPGNWQNALRRYKIAGEHVRISREADYDFIKRAFRHNSLPGIFWVNTSGQVQRLKDPRQLNDVLGAATNRLPNRPYYKGSSGVTTTTQPTVPPTTSTDSGSSSTGWTTYTVKSGDTLYRISRKFSVSVDDIKKWNQLSSNSISVGQNIKIKK